LDTQLILFNFKIFAPASAGERRKSLEEGRGEKKKRGRKREGR
jgi:hypothetical protein